MKGRLSWRWIVVVMSVFRMLGWICVSEVVEGCISGGIVKYWGI